MTLCLKQGAKSPITFHQNKMSFKSKVNYLEYEQ